MSQGLWNESFFEFADDGLLSFTMVVGANSRKWGHFGVVRTRLCAPTLGLMGWCDQSKSCVNAAGLRKVANQIYCQTL